MGPVAAFGQQGDSARAKVDSLAARLERAESAIEMLRQQVAAQGESGTTTRSGLKLTWSGRVMVSAYGNARETNDAEAPSIVPRPSGTEPQGRLGIGLRQTTLGAALAGATAWGASLGADLDFDLYGGASAVGIPRLRTARMVLSWPHAEVLIGQDVPLASALNPVSLAAIGIPSMSAAGNLWEWLPQVRATVSRGTKVKASLAAAILAPSGPNDYDAAYGTASDDEYADAPAHSKRPFVEGRASLHWGDNGDGGEIGVSVHRGWFATADLPMRSADGVMADLLVPIGQIVEVRGEAFSGRGLSTLGGGQIGQLTGKNDVLIGGRGGWLQLNVKPSPRLQFGVGAGVDDPSDADLLPTSMQRNASTESHVIVHPGGPLVVSLEWRRTTTTYAARSWSNDHLNLGVGFEF